MKQNLTQEPSVITDGIGTDRLLYVIFAWIFIIIVAFAYAAITVT